MTARPGSGSSGYYNFNDTSTLTDCVAIGIGSTAFDGCDNLTGCLVDGNGATVNGFYSCNQVSSCRVWDCTHGINNCDRVSACDSRNNSDKGFLNCNYLSACYAFGNGTNWSNCTHTAACND